MSEALTVLHILALVSALAALWHLSRRYDAVLARLDEMEEDVLDLWQAREELSRERRPG